MSFSYKRSYRGGIQAVLLDWAGTTMDFGCMAPAVVFMDVFEREGVPITMEEARAPMGAHKRVHIQRITELPAVRRRWTHTHGAAPTMDDVERMFQKFIPLQIAVLSRYSDLIPGALEVIEAMRSRDYKIGSTTGYNTEMMAVNLADAERQGYVPDSTVCASDVPAGRPHPHMCLQNAINLAVTSVRACVKVDDTVPGVEEGLAAGMWTVGLACSGNEVGMMQADWEGLDPEERRRIRDRAYRRMHQAGAHYVIDSIVELMGCLDDIETRLRRGEAP